MTSLGSKMRRGAAWGLTGKALKAVIAFAIGIALARLLVPADFGLLTTISIFTGVAGFFASGGMGEALVRSPTLDDRDPATVFTMQLVMGLGIYAIFFAVSPYIAAWFKQPIYEVLVRVSALTFVLRPFVGVPRSLLKREMRFREIAITGSTSTLAGSVLSVVLAYKGFGVWSLVVGGLFSPCLQAVSYARHAGWLPRLHFNRESARRVTGFGAKYSLNNFVTYCKRQTANLILSKMLGPDAVGIFNRAISLTDGPKHYLGGSAYDAMFRGLAALNDERGKQRYVFTRSATLLALYTMPCYVLIWWLADPVIVLLYGEHWAPTVEPIKILALTGFFSFGQAGAIVAARDQLGKELLINLETLAVMALAVFAGVRFGLAGVAWAMVGVRLYTAMRMNRLAARVAGVALWDVVRAVVPSYKLAGVMAAFMFISDRAWLAELREPAPIAYALAMLAVGAATFGVAFFYGGIAELASENARWKGLAATTLARLRGRAGGG